jgi:hypothetical protein
MGPIRIGAAVLGLLIAAAGAARAGEFDFAGFISTELRAYPYSPAFDEQYDEPLAPSVALQPEFRYRWNGGDDRFTFVPFARADAADDQRTHIDLRELNWVHLADDWDLLLGVSKVFWGVAESRHLVDIVNQTDLVENIDTEDKLGQPMANLNLLNDWGNFSFFVLPGFRERTFPGDDARLRGALPIAEQEADFESGLKQGHIDLAARWSQVIGDWDIGLAHFYGTGREPRLRPEIDSGGDLVLVPRYDIINQTSLDLQATLDAWLLKLEAITRSGQGERFYATVAGFEYTLFGLSGSAADLGLLAEYLYDSRDEDEAPATPFDDDFFVGARLAFNDVDDTEILAGAVVDRDTQATFVSIEFERRLTENMNLEVEARFFANVPESDLLYGIRRDDYLELRISTFF